MSELMEMEKKKKPAENKPAVVPAPVQTVQRDLQDVNGPAGGMLPGDVSAKIQSKRGSGQRLSDRQLQNYSQKFGRDMSDVHIHTDAESDTISRSLNARAFTIGSDVFLTKGINPDGGGRDAETMTHELTHVVQQGGRASSGPLKLGAADTAAEHEAEATAQREYAPEAASAASDTVQRGFWGNLGKTIGMNALNMFGMGSVAQAFSDFMSGDQKVKAAIENMTVKQHTDYSTVENRIKKLENEDMPGAKDTISTKTSAMQQLVKNHADHAQLEAAFLEMRDAQEHYEELKTEYQDQLNTQVKMLQAIDETITKRDVNRYRSGKAKTFFSSLFGAVGGSIMSGFESDPDKKEEARKKGIAMTNDWFASANKGESDAHEETEEEKEAKAKARERKKDELITEIWQDVRKDDQLKTYYTNWLLFKREVASEHSDLIKESIKDGEPDQMIKSAVITSLKHKNEGRMDKQAAALAKPAPGEGNV